MDRRALEALQLRKLKAQLIRIDDASAYYRDKFSRASVNVHAFDRLEQLREYPFFDKDEERVSQALSAQRAGHPFGLHITCDPRAVNRISSSSGTTGTPTYSGFTRLDRQVTDHNMARAMALIGIEPGDVVMHASVLSMWIAGVPVVDALMSYGACVVPVGALSGVERVAQAAVDTRPRAIICTVSFAQHLANTMRERTAVDPATLGIEKLIVFGEPGGSIADIYGPLEAAFGGATVYDLMGATGCHSPTGASCEAHAGIHYFAEDNAYFEICDPVSLEPLPLEDGVEGEIVFTSLDKECAPLVRWRDKDIIEVTMSPCPCGRTEPRMHFKGRVDDMLLVRGVNVFPNAVRDVINRHSPLTTGNIRIVKPGPGPVVPAPVTITVEVVEDLPDDRKAVLANTLHEALHDQLRFRAVCQFIDRGTFEVLHGPTGKARLVEEKVP